MKRGDGQVTMKIGVLGSHGVGKTTLALDLAQQLQKMGRYSVTVLTELARECPYPLGVNQIPEATNWLISRQISRELELQRHSTVLVCDRTSVDALCYTRASGHLLDENILMVQGSLQWLKTYDLLVWIRPSGHLVDDGYRMLDHGFRQKVDDCFAELLSAFPKERLLSIPQDRIMAPEPRQAFFFELIGEIERQFFDQIQACPFPASTYTINSVKATASVN
jgi:nicotinamide riboside kinase